MEQLSRSQPWPRLAGALLTLLLLLACLLIQGTPVWAGPVDWQEVPSTAEGRQWWDAGSLRFNRDGHLTLLSRFQPSAADPAATDPARAGRAPADPVAKTDGGLYVMEIDCDQNLFRDTSVNGIPRWRSEWQPTSGDDLITEVVKNACLHGADRRIAATP